jgi:adenylosuccinate lyase
MIPRYSRPAMSEIWTEQDKLRRWLEIEVLACEGIQWMRSHCFHSKKPAVELQEHSPSTHDRRCVRVGRLVIYFLS